MRKFALSLGLLALAALAPAAQAVPVDVHYDVTTTAAVVNGLIGVGTFTGTSTVRYRGSGTISAPVVEHGLANIVTWVSSGPISVAHSLLGTAVVTGQQTLSVGWQPKGSLKSTGQVALHLRGTGTALAHCNNTGTGAACTAAPISIPASVPQNGTLPVSTVLAGLAGAPITTGAGNIKSTFTVFGFLGSFNGIAISGTSTFTEVSRTQVPEPSSLSMLWVGVAGLAGARSWHRRRVRK
jgi:hypothetical protein